MEIEEIAREVVDSGYTVHAKLGPGLLESVYEINNNSDFASSRLRVHQEFAESGEK